MDDGRITHHFECSEPGGTIVRHVEPMELSIEQLKFLWEKLKGFDVLFNDFVRGDFKAFMHHFVYQVDGELSSAGLFWSVDDVGILLMKDIIPLQSANVHYVFWDRRFKGREGLCRGMLKYVFDRYKFQRIETRVPLYATDSLLATERLGFVREGRLRRSVLYKGKWFDVNIYSILPEELEKDFNYKNKDKRPARNTVCFGCGKIFDAALRRTRVIKRVSKGVNHGT